MAFAKDSYMRRVDILQAVPEALDNRFRQEPEFYPSLQKKETKHEV